ncbi:hypothetical protein [Salinigranum salinum]|uniref:hypothetical protein n=1 Tax=Salinigranum salinum TaxID=1364937 RepID=UPI001260D3D2|nr:hypothetical protein [Salinigranum salinum]
MKAIDITVGRTVIKALLIAAVLTAGVVGGVGTAAAEPMDGKGNDPYPPDLYASLDGKGNDVPTPPPSLYASLDGKGNDVYPPPGVYASLDGKGNDVYPPPRQYSRDGTKNDAVSFAFPIDNVTVSADYAGRGGGSGKPSL